MPSDKIPVADGKSSILLLRGRPAPGRGWPVPAGAAGRAEPGAVGALHGHPTVPISSYLISLYCSLAVLTPDALAVLDDVRIDRYHDYAALDTYK
ncbi:MAG: hypothetical protein U1E74_00070 [Paenacidovorax caeni]